MKGVLRSYEIRKYVMARSAEEAIRLSKSSPIIEVIDRSDKPQATNDNLAYAIGFQYVGGCDND